MVVRVQYMWGINWSMNLMIILRRVLGTILFIVGVLGLLLPVLPGFLLIGVGLYFLSLDSPGMQLRINQLRREYKHFDMLMKLSDDWQKKEASKEEIGDSEKDIVQSESEDKAETSQKIN